MIRGFLSHILTGTTNNVAITLSDHGPKPVAAERAIDKHPAPACIGRYTRYGGPAGDFTASSVRRWPPQADAGPSQRNPLADRVIRVGPVYNAVTVRLRCTPVLKIVKEAGAPMTPHGRRYSLMEG